MKGGSESMGVPSDCCLGRGPDSGCVDHCTPDETPRDAHRKFIIGNLEHNFNPESDIVIIKPKSVSNMSKISRLLSGTIFSSNFLFRDFQKLTGPQNQPFRMSGSVPILPIANS